MYELPIGSQTYVLVAEYSVLMSNLLLNVPELGASIIWNSAQNKVPLRGPVTKSGAEHVSDANTDLRLPIGG